MIVAVTAGGHRRSPVRVASGESGRPSRRPRRAARRGRRADSRASYTSPPADRHMDRRPRSGHPPAPRARGGTCRSAIRRRAGSGDDGHPMTLTRRQHGRLGPSRRRPSTAAARTRSARAPAERTPTGPRRCTPPGRRTSRGSRTLPGVHEVGEHAERVVEVDGPVEAVHLVEVDVVGAQAAQAASHGQHDPAPRAATAVGVRAHRDEAFVASTTSSRRPRSASPTISSLSPRRVRVGGIDEVDARVEGSADHRRALVTVAVAHLPEHRRPPGTGC